MSLSKASFETYSEHGEYLAVLEAPNESATKLFVAEWERAKDRTAGKFEFDLPRQTDMDMRKLSSYLPRVYYYRVIGDAEDFEVRVVGDDVVSILGFNPTGRRMSEFPNGAWRTESYIEVWKTRRPRVSRVQLRQVDGPRLEVEAVIMPLCNRAGRFDRLMGFFAPID